MKTVLTKPLEQALDSLRRSIEVSKSYLKDTKSSTDLKRTIQAGVIQNFEFCYELAWKILRRKLEIESSDAALINKMFYQEIIREGAQKGLIANAEKWLQYRHQRNLTSHTYHEKTAESVYQTAIEFYDDALKLLHQLQER